MAVVLLQVSRLCQSRVEHTHRAWCLDAFFSDGIQAVIGSTSFNGDVKLWDNPSLDMKTKVCMHCTRCFVTEELLTPYTPVNHPLQGPNAMPVLRQHLAGNLNFERAPASHRLASRCCSISMNKDMSMVGWCRAEGGGVACKLLYNDNMGCSRTVYCCTDHHTRAALVNC